MSKAVYLLVGAAAGAAAVYLIFNAPASTAGEASDSVGSAARKATSWGTGQRVTGTGTEVLGKVKQAVGETTGDNQMANAGVFDQAKGIVKDAAGQVAQGAADVAHDLNR